MRIDLHRPDTLTELKQDCIARVTEAVAAALRTYIPEIPGQEEIYRAKYQEALQVSVTGAKAGQLLTDYAATAGITVAVAAEKVISKYQAWQSAIASAESIRLIHKTKITGMTSESEILQATADTIALCNGLRTS